jgi:hypothetical protein
MLACQSGQSAITNFSIAVDSNTPIFTDPTTGAKQTDSTSGNVYIAWTTITPAPYNPNIIQLVASSNGVSFPTYNPTTDTGNESLAPEIDFGHSGLQRFTAPRIAISQGTAARAGGSVTVIWDDFGSLATATPPQDVIWANTSTVSGTAISPGASDVPITTTTVRGALAAPYPLGTPSSPTGIGPGAQIAVDNTLGS